MLGSAFALGAGTPLAVGAFVLVGLPLVVLAFFLGQALGYAFWISLLALPLPVGVRQVLGTLTTVVVALGSFLLGYGLEGAVDGGLASALPTGPPPPLLGWYADLFFVGTPLATPIESRMLLAAMLVLGAIPLAVTATVRLAPRFWYAVPNDPSTADDGDDAEAATQSVSASATVGRRRPVPCSVSTRSATRGACSRNYR